MQLTSYILLCQVITICAAYTSEDNCSVGLRSRCNTYCLQPYTALFVFVFMAATLHSSFFKGFYYNVYATCVGIFTCIHNEFFCMSLLLIAAHSPNWCNILVAISVSV